MAITAALDRFVSAEVLASVLLITVLLTLRVVLVRALQRNIETLSETRRRWISVTHNTTVVLLLVGLMFIWALELSSIALSLTAFAVALVIAIKEFLLCLVGAIYRTGSGPFDVGDWIEIDGLRGEVIAEGMLSTRLQELGQGGGRYRYTGRVMTVPNSMFLSHTVRNETYRKRFVHHGFDIVLEPGPDPKRLARLICEIIARETQPYDELAGRYWAMVRRKALADLPGRQPRVQISTNEAAKLVLGVTAFCPTGEAEGLQSTIVCAVMNQIVSGADRQGKPGGLQGDEPCSPFMTPQGRGF